VRCRAARRTIPHPIFLHACLAALFSVIPIAGISGFRQVQPKSRDFNPFGNPGPSRGGHGKTVLRTAGETAFASRLDLPLAWDVLARPPSEQTRDAAERSNAGILAFLLHGVDTNAAPRPADERLDEALAPIRTKLDIIIGMLARMSYRAVELPPRCPIELGERQIAWVSEQRLRPQAWLRIAIYFDSTFREPVVVFGQVTASAAIDDGSTCRNEADLAEIPEPTIGDLARLALLVQRRQQARRDVDIVARGKW
jgi:hypothetical protein